MESVLNFFSQGWVGLILAVLGLAFGLYQILRRTGARLMYQYLGQRLIQGGGGLLPSEVSVLYEGEEVPRVSLTQIVIWNSGMAPVRGDDVISEDPISPPLRSGFER